MRNLLLACCAALAFLFSACSDTAVVAVQQGSEISWTTLSNVPPGTDNGLKPIRTLLASRTRALDLSPTAVRLAIHYSKDIPLDTNGDITNSGRVANRIYIHNILTGQEEKLWTEKSLRQVIERASEPYPDYGPIDFIFHEYGWENDSAITLWMQPVTYANQSVPQDVTITLNVLTGDLLAGPVFTDRTAPPGIPIPSPKTPKHPNQLNNRQLEIAGQPVANLSNVRLYDIHFR